MKFSQNSIILHSRAVCVAVSFGKLLVLLNFPLHFTLSFPEGPFRSSGFQTPAELHFFSIINLIGGRGFFRTRSRGEKFRGISSHLNPGC